MILSEPDFLAIVLGSLPKSYNQFLSAVTATASVLKQELNPEDLMQTIIDEFDQCSTRFGTKEKNTDIAFLAGSNNWGGRATKKSNKENKCFNCHKKGHKKVDCWAKGGRKKGQGPRTKVKKEELKKETASVEVEGVWMAAVNDSNDENMANDKFDDFTISEDDMFFSEEEDKEGIKKLTSQLKKQLKIEELFKYSYAYNDLDYMLNAWNFTNFPNDNDNTGTAAIMIESESEDEEEISPYWREIRTNKLQGFGKPIEVLFSDTDSTPDLGNLETLSNEETKKLITFPMELLLDEMDSMLDLENVPESEASSESVIFVFTPANLLCTENSEIGSIKEIMELFNDKETIELAIDKEARTAC